MAVDPLNLEFTRLFEKSGWGKSEAAQKLDLSPSVITRYLNGETRPSMVVLRLFKLLIGDMEPGLHEGDMHLKDESTPIPMEDWEYELLKDVRRLSGEKRREIVKHLRALLHYMAEKDGTTSGKYPQPGKG
jgi:transcriptional regulator with XRE-family HTH domain